MITIPLLSGNGKSTVVSALLKCPSEAVSLLQKEPKSTTKNLALEEIAGTSTRIESHGEIIWFFQSVLEATICSVRKSKLS